MALSLITLILSAVYGSWHATSRSARTVREMNRLNQVGQRLGEQLTRQLRCSYYPQSTPLTQPTGSSKPEPLFRGQAAASSDPILDFVTTETLSFGEEAQLGLVRAQYRFDPGSGVLYHREAAYINNHTSNHWPEWQELAVGITSIDLGYSDGQEEQEQWNSAKENRLPHEVRISITLQDSELSSRTFDYVVHPESMFVRSGGA